MSGCKFFGSPNLRCGDLKAERAGVCLNIVHFQHSGRIADISQDRQPAEGRDYFAQGFESLGSKIGLLI